MAISTFKVIVASPPDRPSAVAELWVGPDQMAELRKDGGTVMLQLYSNAQDPAWDVEYDDFVTALALARQQLIDVK